MSKIILIKYIFVYQSGTFHWYYKQPAEIQIESFAASLQQK